MDRIFLKNSLNLYMLTLAKFLLPLITLPYLTRVLSVDSYGIIAYIKSLMGYAQLIIDFGYMLSVTREIAEHKKVNDWHKISSIVSTTTFSRIFLCAITLLLSLIIGKKIPIINDNIIIFVLYYFSIAISLFCFDFLFRGIEKMEILSIRFVLSKIISVIFILLLVKGDNDLILMGFIEIIGSMIAAVFSFIEIKKLNIILIIPKISDCIKNIKNSLIYFLSNFSTTAFSLMITFLIGLYMKPSDVAYWSLALQVVVMIQSFYSPIIESLYPALIREFRTSLIMRTLYFAIPLIIFGCIVIYSYGDLILTVLVGDSYYASYQTLVYLIPLLIISFPAMLFGWPVLGSMGYAKEVTCTTVLASVIQIALLFYLIYSNSFNILFIAITRNVSEFILMISRILIFCHKLK